MAEKKIIAAKIEVDAGSANTSVKEFNKNVNTAKQSLGEIGGSASAAGKGIGEAGGHFSNLTKQLSIVPGAAGQAASGVQSLGSAFKALLANPVVLVITLIVGALTLLYKAFTSTAEGADKVEQIFSGISAVVEVVRDRILKFAGAIVKFFSGDFKGAVNDAKASISGFGDQVASEFKKAADATKLLQEVEDAMRDLGVARAKLNRDLARSKELISDETASYKDRIKAVNDVRAAEAKLTSEELENAKKTLQARIALAGTDTSDEEADAIAEAKANVYRIEQESAANIRSLNKQERSIEKEAAGKAREEQQKRIEQEKEAKQKLAEFNANIRKLQQENELLGIKDSYAKEQAALEQKIANDKLANEKAFQEKKLTRAQYLEIEKALEINGNLQRDELTQKHNDDITKKEEEFQKELNAVRNRVTLAGITDQRSIERAQLQLGYEEKLNDAIKRYADDQAKFFEFKQAIDEEFRLQQATLDEKIRIEDEKKKFDAEIKIQEGVVNDPQATFKEKFAALDAEVSATQAAFDAKAISEEQFNEKSKSLTDARIALGKAEREERLATFGAIGGAFETLSNLVGKKTAAGKALAIAAATISAIQSAVNSFNSLSVIPIVGPALGAVAAAGALAAGYANVKKIVSVQVPGQGGGGGAPSVGGAAVPPAPVIPAQQQGVKLDQDSINAAGNIAQGGVNRSARAYVLGSDIQSDADRNSRLERASRLGG